MHMLYPGDVALPVYERCTVIHPPIARLQQRADHVGRVTTGNIGGHVGDGPWHRLGHFFCVNAVVLTQILRGIFLSLGRGQTLVSTLASSRRTYSLVNRYPLPR